MHPVIESLLEVVERDPYPNGYTSVYWRREGEKTRIRRDGNTVCLMGFGIGTSRRQGLAWQAARGLERLSYRRVIRELRSYPRNWKLAKRLARELSIPTTYDVWRYAVIFSVLTDHWDAHGLSPRTFAMIGDGNGFLGALVRRARPIARMYSIDLPKTLVFQACTHGKAGRRASMARLAGNGSPNAEVTFVLPQEIEEIPDPIDCAVNVASMQEMSEHSIATYFTFLRRRSERDSRFYCVNRGTKTLPGGEVTQFSDYPWCREDQIFLDGRCAYYHHYVSRCMTSRGPRLFGLRVPFVNYFDGDMLHRLVHLAPLTGVSAG